jgi:hypothetical protein
MIYCFARKLYNKILGATIFGNIHILSLVNNCDIFFSHINILVNVDYIQMKLEI